MYKKFKRYVLELMMAPTEPPEPPAGSEGSVQIYRASPHYLRYRLFLFWSGIATAWIAVIGWGIGLAFTGLEIFMVLDAIVIPFLIVTQFLGYFTTRMDYDLRYYIVTDRSIRVREGAVVVKEMTISHANVQNLRVVQGPILRYFGIWTLKIDTAGGGSGERGAANGAHQVELAGIENAHEVRDLILGHLKKRGGGAGLGDLDDGAARTTARPSEAVLTALARVRESAAALRRACEAS